jgi:TolB-like protein/Tfp pilus assembly protein PilF
MSILGVGALLLASVAWIALSRLNADHPIHSLAVLPLENLSGDPAQEYFAGGMTDELTTELARIPNLRVVSRTSVMADMGPRRPLPDIARQLNVDAIVEGSIVRSGDRIRITAQLIDARTDRHLWAQSFEGPASDVLSLQDSVAQQIALEARLVLTPPSSHAPVNPAAHDAYLRGRYFLNKQDLPHSLESFQQAIALDPTYASAYAGYATALDAASTFGIGTPDQLMPKARAAAQRAIQLDPQNGEAYTALGSVQTIYEWDWTAAQQNLTRAISLNPNDSIAEFKYAVYLDAEGRPQDAVAHMRRALQLDPLSFLVNRRLGATLYLARQYDAALAQIERAAEMEQRPGSIDKYVSLIYEQKGEHDEAVQYDLQALHDDYPQLDITSLLDAYHQHGWQPYWRARTRALLAASVGPCTAYEIGVDDLRVKDLNHAFASFQRALDNHCFYMALIRVDPLLDSVRSDSRYAALLTRMRQ